MNDKLGGDMELEVVKIPDEATAVKNTGMEIHTARTDVQENTALASLQLEEIEFGESLTIGGEVLKVTDEAFAEAENLINPNDPQFAFGDFDPKRGQVFSSWETSRHSQVGHETVDLKLGRPGIVSCVVIDTKWHDGNHAQLAAVFALQDGSDEWVQLIAPSELQGHSAHIFRVDDQRVWSSVRLVMYPDGGIARLNVYESIDPKLAGLNIGQTLGIRHSEEVPKPTEKEKFAYPDQGSIDALRAQIDWSQPVCLTNIELGARIVATSDERYSHAGNILQAGAPENMGDGWENARFRLSAEDLLAGKYERIWDHSEWVVIQMSDRGTVDELQVDFRYFNFNNPAFMEVEACDVSGSPTDADWQIISKKQSVKEFASNSDVSLPVESHGPFTHLRVKIFPCGGVHRVKVIGKRVDA